jgi:lipoprotein-releasing system permease protein
MPLFLEVALGYLRSRPSRLVSSVSLLSIGGIALGVAALVVAMGLLSGYRREIQERLIGANAEVVVFPLPLPSGDYPDARSLASRLSRIPRVRAVAPVIYQAGVASSAATPDGVDAVLKGVDPKAERAISPMGDFLPPREGPSASGAGEKPPGVAIGVELARRLDVKEGDPIALSVPDKSSAADRFVPRTGRFRVTRVFRTNFAEYDSEWVFLDRETLRAFSRLGAEADIVEVKLDTIRDTESAAREIEKAAGPGFSVTDWRRMNGNLFSALAIQQATLFLVIGLIVGVSTFNVVATLVMTVQEKKRDIGVLSALGAEPRFFSRVFLALGALLGGTGVAAGILFGWAICKAATAFRLLSFPPGVAEIYFVSFIPFLVRVIDLAAIVGFSALAILLASWLPARRAARIDIADVLRYE